jgi:transposase-like protein
MQSIIAMELLATVSDNGFSLDELVHELGRVSQDKGLPGIAAMILRLVDEMLLLRHTQGQPWPGGDCCQQPAYESLGMQQRKIRTGIGVVEFCWRRYRCKACGKTRVPLRDLLGLDRHQSRSNELERIVVEVVTEQSYRRSSNHLETVGKIPVPKSTAHRWLVRTESDALAAPTEKFSTLLSDGTGYKRRPDPALGLDNQGQLRMALGITPAGQVKALGAWSGKSWQEIAQELGAGLAKDQKLAGMLVSDGEPGLAEALGGLTEEQQRCIWHMTHDLDVPLRRDHVGKQERRGLQKELAGVVKIELPAEDGQPVRSEDRQEVQEALQAAEGELSRFSSKLTERGYRQAATYVQEAKERLFSYVRFWLKHGIASPRVSSFIERLMREIARRLKRIAFGWRPDNAAKMARLVLKRVTDPAEWAAYWRKRLRLDGNVMIAFRGVHSTTPPTLGH